MHKKICDEQKNNGDELEKRGRERERKRQKEKE